MPEAEVLGAALRGDRAARARRRPALRRLRRPAREPRRRSSPSFARSFEARTTDEWLDVLAAAGVPNARVNDVAEALAEPQVEARGGIVETEHPRLGTVRQVATPLRVGEEEKPSRRAPFRGEHTEQVLVDLCGYSTERVRELAAAGVLGDVVI